MAKVWVLDTETKGTGAEMVPLEKVQKDAEGRPPRRRPPARKRRRSAAPTREHGRERRSTPLPPGHVRKRATGELGKVKAVDARAGTATVRWLKSGSSSTVALSAVSRR